MTDLLREVMTEIAFDGATPRLTAADVVTRVHRRRSRRRWLVAVSAVATAMPVLGLGVAFAVTRTPAPHPVVTAAQAAPSMIAPTEEPRPAAPTHTSMPLTPPSQQSQPAGTPARAKPNQLADPGFEKQPPGGWVFGPATVLTVSPSARSGRQALRITTTSTTKTVAGATADPVLVITTADVHYTASCWVSSETRIGAYVQVQEYTRDWKRAGDAAPSAKVTLTDPGRWYQVSVGYVAQHTGNQLPLTVFSFDLLAGGASFLVDDCTMVAD